MPAPRPYSILNDSYTSDKALVAATIDEALGQFNHLHDQNLAIDLLRTVFSHPSFTHENGGMHHEQFEFLGDAVLSLWITDKLCSLYPDVREGKLSKMRSSLVNEKILATLSRDLSLADFILVGKGEWKQKTHEKDSVLANTFEAILGALYRQGGVEMAARFLNKVFENKDHYFDLKNLEQFDVKSKLQELCLEKFKLLPRYESVEMTQDKKVFFETSLFIGEKLITKAVAPSKKEGELLCAQQCLTNNLTAL